MRRVRRAQKSRRGHSSSKQLCIGRTSAENTRKKRNKEQENVVKCQRGKDTEEGISEVKQREVYKTCTAL